MSQTEYVDYEPPLLQNNVLTATGLSRSCEGKTFPDQMRSEDC